MKNHLMKVFDLIFSFQFLKKIFPHFKKFFLFVHLFFLIGCFNSSSSKSFERLFLENVMIREKGLYVLMGTKPLSCFEVEDIYSENTVRSAYKNYLKNKPVSPMNFEEFHKQYKQTLPKLPLRLRFETLWKHWCETKEGSISPCYRFVARKAPFNHEINFGLFINVPSTTYILKKNYESFSQITGISFDPITVIDEISDKNSLFWERVFHNHYLMGLLFGFGERNAFIFDWGAQHEAFLSDQQEVKLCDKRFIDENKSFISPRDLKLPLFGSFSINDPYLENYKKEQKQIINRFKRKDFVTVVMNWLAPTDSSPKK